ncbi:hypothetical protein GA830_00470 [Mesorhizobium sp. NBSH29]|uniref:hypothetical protein n=1 Tax=Mesorhizobium sp. NBSH29 TaxID=2654249 RepID=UPI00189682CA|nr:hypothetical protein [Mesorhizobium sp. NBSH29]QPC85384.1 hypothetical protein GA830_00470 [Mesorhizobium sp. NBSH29]
MPDNRADVPRPGVSRFWRRKPKPRIAFTAERHSDKGTSDIVIAALGIGLGLLCALFPWYIFFNQDQFGIRALKFEGNREIKGPIELTPQPDRVGAGIEPLELDPSKIDLFATGTLPKSPDDNAEKSPGVEVQPFPGDHEFRLVYVANGRAMIQDDTGLFVVQQGSRLPDRSNVARIEQRSGKWVVVTTSNQVLETNP